ncbi:MAG: DUF2254 domain-containing protein [Spirosomataceae bacterium]
MKKFYSKIKTDWKLLSFCSLLIVLVLTTVVHQFVKVGQASLEGMMNTLLGVLTTIVVTTFSFVFVALQLASVQFSPRILRSFFEYDHFSRFFLWSFLGCIGYVFGLIYLGYTSAEAFLPKTALVGGLYLVVLVFPLFIHHVVENINASSITKNIMNRTLNEIEMLYTDASLTEVESDKFIIKSTESGYLESVNFRKLEALLDGFEYEKFTIIVHVGGFVMTGSPIIEIDGLKKDIVQDVRQKLFNTLTISKFRSYTQDIMFGVRQLVDIAIKAISPAVNDPTTALNCIDYLGVIVGRISAVQDVSRDIARLRSKNIYVREFNYEQLIDVAFDQIYHWGKSDYIVVRHLVKTIAMIVPFTNSAEKLKTLIREVEDMELGFLFSKDFSDCIFDRREHRNSIRDFMDEFYLAVIKQIDRFEPNEQLSTKKNEYIGLRKSLKEFYERT